MQSLHTVLIILPIISIALLIFSTSIIFAGNNKRINFLRGLQLYMVFTVGLIEILNWIYRVNFIGLLIGSVLLILFCLAFIIKNRPKIKAFDFSNVVSQKDYSHKLFLAIILIVGASTLLTAMAAPPQTWDSLTYHMSRIIHWVQNQSINHYATGIERQNSMSPGAEFLGLNFYLLTGGDLFANLPQWIAMLFSAIGGSLIALYLGAKRTGQWLTAVFVVTLPSGIVQASSTMTDYVATVWLVCAAAEVLAYKESKQTRSIIFAAISAGLAILAKPTVFFYLLFLGGWMAVFILRSLKIKKIAAYGFLVILIVFSINAGYLSRNLSTYGSLSNPADYSHHLNELRTPAGIFSNVIKNTSLHAGIPWPAYNKTLENLIKSLIFKLGVDIHDPRSTGSGEVAVRTPSKSEAHTSNPLHAYFSVITIILLLLSRKQRSPVRIIYVLGIASAFVLDAGLFKWFSFNARLHLPFFVIFAPVLGVFWGSLKLKVFPIAIALIFFIFSLPWAFSIDTRSLIPTESSTKDRSILVLPREERYFTSVSSAYAAEFKALSTTIEAQGCTKIGLLLNGDDPEYWLWVLLGAPDPNYRLEWIVAATPSEVYGDESFSPCAIICRNCEPSSVLSKSTYAGSYIGTQLYFAVK